jgi:signal peptidase II
MLVLIGSACIVLLIDQISKALVVRSFSRGGFQEIFFGLVRLDFTRNSGAAFGLFQSSGPVFAVVAVAVTIAILSNYRRIASSSATVRVALGMIVGGATGNLIDRIRLGYVVDFIDLRWWYVFNVADSAIVIGVCLLLLAPHRWEVRRRL